MQKLDRIARHRFAFTETVIKDYVILLHLFLEMIIIILLLQKLCQFNIMCRRKTESVLCGEKLKDLSGCRNTLHRIRSAKNLVNKAKHRFALTL